MITLGVVAELLEDCAAAVSRMMADLAASGRRRRRLQHVVLTAPSNFRSPAVATAIDLHGCDLTPAIEANEALRCRQFSWRDQSCTRVKEIKCRKASLW
ncbi:hypothetical protein AKJ16_DCAP19094 [Drosera capensis]